MAKTIYRPDPDRDPVGPFLHYLMAECGVSPHSGGLPIGSHALPSLRKVTRRALWDVWKSVP